MSKADVGISTSDSAAIAQEIADITIATDSLWELVELFRIAMSLMVRIHSNSRFTIGFHGALIALGMAEIIPPPTSATQYHVSMLGFCLWSMSRLTQKSNPPNIAIYKSNKIFYWLA